MTLSQRTLTERWGCGFSAVEAIAAAYLAITAGDPSLALRMAIADALADRMEAERRTQRRDRLLQGFVREGAWNMPAHKHRSPKWRFASPAPSAL
ncbi:hypothetical protein Mnod_7483 [Methylobacterium nodulans ORS 2060]|uniref:Uncharacterized protein n=1 Tax=Methylobacterium nodulans (strain LMG 21967 / CNCM I-2342 / ORS 2060) TaxID=460265 RepID=B8IPC8_METNO|nr:hypothetical protein [Methylobacterium nodulans]ACL62220.1 hypothetical protein Mnod_7483 [Methylobacterium nodulans ORS 2060]